MEILLLFHSNQSNQLHSYTSSISVRLVRFLQRNVCQQASPCGPLLGSPLKFAAENRGTHSSSPVGTLQQHHHSDAHTSWQSLPG